jgi:hypothetical protein
MNSKDGNNNVDDFYHPETGKFITYFLRAARNAVARGVGFPDPNDRTPNQPSVIIQPNVISELMEQIKCLSVGFARQDCLDTNITNNWDNQIAYFLQHAFKKDITSKYFDAFMFAAIAKCLDWHSAAVYGKQVILTCSVVNNSQRHS